MGKMNVKREGFRLHQCSKKKAFDSPQRLSQIFIKEHQN